MTSFPSQNAGYVQANSVQSQFAALTRDRDDFQREKNDAERESRQAQERLRHLKEEQVGLMSKIQATQETLGTLSRNQAMLQQEENRLQKVMHKERKSLEVYAANTANLVNKEKETTALFIQDMNKANGEAARLLGKQLVQKIVKNISVDSVEAVVPFDSMWATCKEKLDQMKVLQQKLSGESTHYETVKGRFHQTDTRSSVMPHTPSDASGSTQMEIFYSMDSNRAAA